MTRNRFRLVFYGILTLSVMLMIFIMSAQDGAESGNLSEWLLSTSFGQLLIRILPKLSDAGEGFDIRKYAHMAEYALLAFSSVHFIMELFADFGVLPLQSSFCALLLSFLYACSDEFHQTFVPGRAGQFKDVLIDTAGALIGLIVVTLIRMVVRKDLK